MSSTKNQVALYSSRSTPKGVFFLNHDNDHVFPVKRIFSVNAYEFQPFHRRDWRVSEVSEQARQLHVAKQNAAI